MNTRVETLVSMAGRLAEAVVECFLPRRYRAEARWNGIHQILATEDRRLMALEEARSACHQEPSLQ